MLEKFFMVNVDKGQHPSVRHKTYEAAAAEAIRLAHKTSEVAYVLVTCAAFTPNLDVTEDKIS